MNYDQAKELSFLVKWKVTECFSGPQCWCGRIVPVDPILYNYTESSDYEEEYEIVGDAAIDQKTAEYIVRLHNEDYERVQQSCRDAMKETMNSLINPAPVSRPPETRKIIRKEID